MIRLVKKAKASDYEEISVSDFILAARLYASVSDSLVATPLYMIASHVLEKGREKALINLLCITAEVSKCTRENKDGLRFWSIDKFDACLQNFVLTE